MASTWWMDLYDNGYSSLGFCATNQFGDEGFIMSGHSTDGYFSTVSYYSSGTYTPIGSVANRAVHSNIDAAFVECKSQGTITNDISSSYDVIGGSSYNWPQYTSVKMYGGASGLKSGYIIDNDVTWSYIRPDNIIQYHWGMVKTSFNSVGGDSGSPIFMVEYSNKVSIVGIVSGSSTNKCIYTKYDVIKSMFNITPKTN